MVLRRINFRLLKRRYVALPKSSYKILIAGIILIFLFWDRMGNDKGFYADDSDY